MSLKNCKECGNSVSSKAEKCPHCGNPIKQKSSCFSTGCLIVIILFALAYFIGTILPNDQASSYTKNYTNTNSYSSNHKKIKYEISGSASSVSVTYSDKNDGTAQISEAYLPWSYEFTATNSHFLYLSAQNNGEYGSVKVTIYIDNVVYKTTSSRGSYVIASVSGSI